VPSPSLTPAAAAGSSPPAAHAPGGPWLPAAGQWQAPAGSGWGGVGWGGVGWGGVGWGGVGWGGGPQHNRGLRGGSDFVTSPTRTDNEAAGQWQAPAGSGRRGNRQLVMMEM
jgi:hypothetical protein